MKKGFFERKKWILGVLMLYIGAYFFGQYVTIPLTHRNDAAVVEAQTAKLSSENTAENTLTAPEEKLLNKNLAAGSAEKGEKQNVSFFLADLQYLDPQETIDMLNACQATTMTVPLVWRELEKEKGNFNPSVYDELLTPYVEAGFSFIFLIDGANRPICDSVHDTIDDYSIPDWVIAEDSIERQRDFSGGIDDTYGWSYTSETSRELYLAFAEKTIDYFGSKYAGQVVGFAPGIQSEFEVKYNQVGYCWTDYSTSAVEQFRDFLREKYGSIEQMNVCLNTAYIDFALVNPPIITYNNSFMNGVLNDDPLFYDFQMYREQALVECLIPFYNLVHEMGQKTVSYFGQLLTPMDAIYATGVGTKLGSYVDLAVIDYNFYNGYDVQYDSILPAMMVNYLHSAGYPEIWAGIYLERVQDFIDNVDFFRETIDYVSADGIADGIEVGGLLQIFQNGGKNAISTLTYGLTERTQQPKIAICAGEWVFYKSHGEDVSCYNYFTDSVSQLYKIIRFELGYSVDILCDDAILNGALSEYELVFLPAQIYVEPQVRACVEAYIEAGGKAIQDYRYGEFDASGNTVGSWSDEYFNIAAREAKCEELNLTAVEPSVGPGAETIRVKNYYPNIANAYSIASADGSCNYLFKDEGERYYGLYTSNTVVLSLQPQIMYRYAQSEEERAGCVALVDDMIRLMIGDRAQ